MPEPFSRIFLLSHMRAFTSLAGHILGSHPHINGYFEMHIDYDDASTLDKQLEALRQHETIKENSRYLFDKLLHNDYALKPDQLGLIDIKILVALREPEQTIKSVVNLFAQKEWDDLYASPAEAAKYYVERVRELADFCRTVKQDFCYFDSELFQSAPGTLLPKLTQWLELASPLSERYDIFSGTGKAGKGDSSERIQTGKISETKSEYPEIHIPEEKLKKAQAVYRECRDQIIGNSADSLTK